MRAAGKLASEVLQHAGSMLKAGMTTNDIDLIVHEMTIAAGESTCPPSTLTDQAMPHIRMYHGGHANRIDSSDIDEVATGAYPSPLNYSGFPKSVCTSLNECICHGIPDTTVIQVCRPSSFTMPKMEQGRD